MNDIPLGAIIVFYSVAGICVGFLTAVILHSRTRRNR